MPPLGGPKSRPFPETLPLRRSQSRCFPKTSSLRRSQSCRFQKQRHCGARGHTFSRKRRRCGARSGNVCGLFGQKCVFLAQNPEKHAFMRGLEYPKQGDYRLRRRSETTAPAKPVPKTRRTYSPFHHRRMESSQPHFAFCDCSSSSSSFLANFVLVVSSPNPLPIIS